MPLAVIAPLSRRAMLSRTACSAAMALQGWPAAAEPAAPYPTDPTYRLRRVDSSWLWRRGCESDQWPHTAVDTKTIIAGWGDGWGIQRPGDEPKSAIGFTRFSGGAAAPLASDLWSDSRSASIRALSLKPQALLTVGDAVYVYAMGLADDRDRTRLYRLSLDGANFSLVADSVIRKSVEGLQVVGTVHRVPQQAGPIILLLAEHGGLRSADLYVDGPKNPTVWAARATPGTLGNSAAWEWFCGRDGSGYPTWSRATVRDRVFATTTGRTVVPAFADPRGAGKHVMISRCPSLKGFVLAKTQNWLELGLFYAPGPLGPWTTLWYGPFVPPGYVEDARIFTAQVATNWSQDGAVAVMWSGAPRPAACADPASGNYDAVHLTRFAVERL